VGGGLHVAFSLREGMIARLVRVMMLALPTWLHIPLSGTVGRLAMVAVLLRLA
jgi:hypothetical protein